MSLSPKPGSYCRVYRSNGSDLNYSSTAMSEVNLSASKWGSHARFTVYRITDSAKRIMNDSALPSFGKKIHGVGDYVGLAVSDLLENDSLLLPNDDLLLDALDVSEVWYGAGYIVLGSALNFDDTVACITGKYRAPTELLGCATRQFEDKTVMAEYTSIGNTAVKRWPILDDWAGKLDVFDDSGNLVDYSGMRLEKVAFRFYTNFSAGLMHVGFGLISNVEQSGGPSDLSKIALTVQGTKYRLYQVQE
jgi:hypothetical protein